MEGGFQLRENWIQLARSCRNSLSTEITDVTFEAATNGHGKARLSQPNLVFDTVHTVLLRKKASTQQPRYILRRLANRIVGREQRERSSRTLA
jgi:hypothetical protein